MVNIHNNITAFVTQIVTKLCLRTNTHLYSDICTVFGQFGNLGELNFNLHYTIKNVVGFMLYMFFIKNLLF